MGLLILDFTAGAYGWGPMSLFWEIITLRLFSFLREFILNFPVSIPLPPLRLVFPNSELLCVHFLLRKKESPISCYRRIEIFGRMAPFLPDWEKTHLCRESASPVWVALNLKNKKKPFECTHN